MRLLIKCFALFTACILLQYASFAQKQTISVQQIWVGYFNQSRFSNHLGSYIEAQLHTKEQFATGWSQSITSLGLNYYIPNNAKFTAAYSFVDNFPADSHKNFSQPEHRIWEQLQWQSSYPALRVSQWVRLEQRFKRKIKNVNELAEDYAYSNRIRYFLSLAAPLSKNRFAANTVAFNCSDEVYINFGKEILYNYFDQNRFFVGINYYTNNHDYIQAGYLNVFEQLSAGNKYKDYHVAKVYYFHNLDWRHMRMTSSE